MRHFFATHTLRDASVDASILTESAAESRALGKYFSSLSAGTKIADRRTKVRARATEEENRTPKNPFILEDCGTCLKNPSSRLLQ